MSKPSYRTSEAPPVEAGLARIAAWNWSRGAVLERIEYDVSGGELRLWGVFDAGSGPPGHEGFVRVTFRFRGVSMFSLKDSSFPLQIIGFEARSLAGRQYEAIRVEVDDYERGRIHFFAHDADVEGVEPWTDPLGPV